MITLMFLSLACTGSNAPASSDSGDEITVEPPPEFPEYSGAGDCPTFEAGVNSGFDSAGQNRKFHLVLPEEPEGAPLIFSWHPLGWNAQDWFDYMDLEEWAQEAGAILVVPSSCCSIAEWMFFSPATDNEDLIFFDDTLNCLWQQYAYDHKRIYTTGMSAGGLFSTFLTLHRSEWLAASVLFSGGTEGFFSYRTPADPIPALVAWGGPTDTWGSYDFDVSSQAFSEDLREDGHFVAECMHGSGHTLSPSWLDWAWTWMADHPKGVDPEPYEDGLPGEFPNWCDIPE